MIDVSNRIYPIVPPKNYMDIYNLGVTNFMFLAGYDYPDNIISILEDRHTNKILDNGLAEGIKLTTRELDTKRLNFRADYFLLPDYYDKDNVVEKKDGVKKVAELGFKRAKSYIEDSILERKNLGVIVKSINDDIIKKYEDLLGSKIKKIFIARVLERTKLTEYYLNKGYNIHWLGCSCREDYKRLAKDYTEVTMDTAELVNLGSNFSSYLEGKEVENRRRPDFETYIMSKEELDTLMKNLEMLKDI